MTNKEKLTKVIIETIHGASYDNGVLQKEFEEGCRIRDNLTGDSFLYHKGNFLNGEFEILGFDITISRIMKGLYANAQRECHKYDGEGACDCWQSQYVDPLKRMLEIWQQNPLGTETLDDQSEETIEELLKLFG